MRWKYIILLESILISLCNYMRFFKTFKNFLLNLVFCLFGYGMGWDGFLSLEFMKRERKKEREEEENESIYI